MAVKHLFHLALVLFFDAGWMIAGIIQRCLYGLSLGQRNKWTNEKCPQSRSCKIAEQEDKELGDLYFVTTD